MRSRYHLALLGSAIVLIGSTFGQNEKEPKPAPTPAVKPEVFPVEVRFADDSSVKAALQQKSIEVSTRYGKLTVPVDEIRSIEFGLRIPEEAAKRIEAAIGKLGNQEFAQREAATTELLELREMAYPALQQAARSTDAEVSRRAREAIKTLAETIPDEKLHLPRYDTVVALDFTIIGHVETPSVKARTPYFGETTLKLAEVRGMRWLVNDHETKLSVDAARYAAQQEKWLDTGLKLRAGSGVQVTASGTVDLRPAAGDAGTYLVGPDGRSTRQLGGRGGFGGGPGGGGRGGRGLAPGGGGMAFTPGIQAPGVLLGRVGEYGKVFIIGSRYEGVAGDDGKLYLRIVPNSTNNESGGSYEVRIATGR